MTNLRSDYKLKIPFLLKKLGLNGFQTLMNALNSFMLSIRGKKLLIEYLNYLMLRETFLSLIMIFKKKFFVSIPGLWVQLLKVF